MIVTKKMLDNEYTGSGIMEEEDHKIVGQWEKGVANGFQILRANGEFHSAREWKNGKKDGLEVICNRKDAGPHDIRVKEYIDGEPTTFGTHQLENGNVFLGDLDETGNGTGVMICDDQIFIGKIEEFIPDVEGEWVDAEMWKYQT